VGIPKRKDRTCNDARFLKAGIIFLCAYYF
jgi:hypothetical protein